MTVNLKKAVAASVTASLLLASVQPAFASTVNQQNGSLINVVNSSNSLEGYALETSFPNQGKPLAEQQAAPILFWLGSLAIRLSSHAIGQAAARGISQHMIKQTILNGARAHGNNNTWIYRSGNIRVIVNKSTGNVVTVTRG